MIAETLTSRHSEAIPSGERDAAILDAWSGATIVVKYGGAAMTEPALKAAFVQDIALLRSHGIRMIVVHGGGNEVTAIAAALGIETRFIDGQRYTDQGTMRVVQMVLAGGINKELVALLNRCDCPAIGICGLDGGLLTTTRHAPGGVDLGYVGTVTGVNRLFLQKLLQAGLLPVIAPLGTGEGGEIHNINADLAATAIAGAMAADSLIYLTDVEGIRKGGSVVPLISRSDGLALIERGEATGGMIPKLQGALQALATVPAINIVDGRRKHVLLDLLAGDQIGTRIINDSTHDRKEYAHE
jgi:acetylglutamate kinase